VSRLTRIVAYLLAPLAVSGAVGAWWAKPGAGVMAQLSLAWQRVAVPRVEVRVAPRSLEEDQRDGERTSAASRPHPLGEALTGDELAWLDGLRDRFRQLQAADWRTTFRDAQRHASQCEAWARAVEARRARDYPGSVRSPLDVMMTLCEPGLDRGSGDDAAALEFGLSYRRVTHGAQVDAPDLPLAHRLACLDLEGRRPARRPLLGSSSSAQDSAVEVALALRCADVVDAELPPQDVDAAQAVAVASAASPCATAYGLLGVDDSAQAVTALEDLGARVQLRSVFSLAALSLTHGCEAP